MEELLIEKVRQHEIIYNPKAIDYRDNHIRLAVWEEIGNDLNMSAKKAKDYWEKLRRCFYNARKRRLEDKKSGKGGTKKLWKHELQMDFLTPFIENRKRQSSLYESSNEAGSDEDPVDFQMEEEEDSKFDLHYKQNVQTNISTVNHEAVKAFQNKRRQTAATTTTEILQMLKENAERSGNKCEENNTTPSTTNIESMDEMDMFFLSMSRMTKQLPKVEQAKIKLGLSNAVLSAEIRSQQRQFHHSFGQVQQQPQTSTPPPNMNSFSLPSDCTSPYYSVASETELKVNIN